MKAAASSKDAQKEKDNVDSMSIDISELGDMMDQMSQFIGHTQQKAT